MNEPVLTWPVMTWLDLTLPDLTKSVLNGTILIWCVLATPVIALLSLQLWFFIPSKNFFTTFETPSRYLLDTLQTSTRHPMNTNKTPSKFQLSTDYIDFKLYIMWLGRWLGGWVSGWVGWWSHLHNNATLWPNLQVRTCQNSTQVEFQVAPSVATRKSTRGTWSVVYIPRFLCMNLTHKIKIMCHLSWQHLSMQHLSWLEIPPIKSMWNNF